MVRHFESVDFILIEDIFIFLEFSSDEFSDCDDFLFLSDHATGQFETVSEYEE